MKMEGNKLNREISNRYRGLLRICRPALSPGDYKMIRKALNLAIAVYGNRQTVTGKPSILHAISVARIVASEIGLGATSIAAALLLDVPGDAAYPSGKLREIFTDHVVEVLDGLSKISGIETEKTHLQAENFRKLLLNLAGDIRVILIKLAERLEYMRNLKGIAREDRIPILSETYYLYAPLAHRLGLYNMKSEMEDLALMYTEPQKYRLIEKKLKDTTASRNRFIREFSDPLKKTLAESGFTFEIRGRLKSIHSIWMKMKHQNVDFEEVYDLFAIRIILDSLPEREKADCWQVYSHVTDLYQPNPQRMRDWISVPKTNGYESLHTTVVGPGGRWVEVQIRTTRMNEIAEKGFAAHWKYKGMKTEKGIEEWLTGMREILEGQEPETPEFIDQVKLNLYSDEIFVFTPKGDLKQLPAGTTLLDFAFDIHTEIGFTCVGGQVNNRNVSIRHTLQNGDQVSVLTSKNQKPKHDWLGFVVTSKAKSKIKQALDKEKFREAESGKEILKRRLRNWKIPFNDQNIKKLLRQYRLKTAQDLYYQVSIEKIDLGEIKNFLTRDEKNQGTRSGEIREAPVKKEIAPGKEVAEDFLVIDSKVKNLDYRLAKCCHPIPGDDIFGFVTISEGIKIHRVNCPNAPQLFSKYGYRIIDAQWSRADGTGAFQSVIRISGIDDIGMVNRISDVVSRDPKVTMRSVSIESKDGMFEGILKVLVSDTKHLETILRKLQRVKGVIRAVRHDEHREG